MTSMRFKRPSSARRNIKQETFTPCVSGTRLRHIQSLLSDGSRKTKDLPDSILCISGIDSRYNDGTVELINYLLFGFFDVRKAELERSGFDEEVVDDIMFLIQRDQVDVYCNPINYHYLLPYVSHWRNVFFHCLTDTQYEDDEAAEEFKIQTFVSIVRNCKKVGIPFSNSSSIQQFDKFAIEKWPIIQAYALEGIGGGGFFTMIHDVEDVSEAVHKVYSIVDPVSLETIIVEQLPRLETQWTTMVSTLNVDMSSSPELLTEGKVCEPLQSFFIHGRASGGGDASSHGKKPFVLFGSDTTKTGMLRSQNGENPPNNDIASTTFGLNQANHMVCQAVSPRGPISCARSYFFSRDFIDPFQDSKVRQFKENRDLRNLIQIYSAMVESVLTAISVYSESMQVQQAQDAALQRLHQECSNISETVITKFLHNRPEIEFQLETADHFGRCCKLKEGERTVSVKTASMTVYNIPSCEKSGSVIGSLVFSEAFIDSAVKVRSESGGDSLNGDYLLLTGHIPRILCWAYRGLDKDRKLLQGRLCQDQVEGFGKLLMSGEPVYVGADNSLSSPPAEANLFAYENGLVIMQPRTGAVSLHGSYLKSVLFYDGEESNSVAVLVLEYQSGIAAQLPVHLCQNNTLTLAFNPKSKAYKQLYSAVLHGWKEDSAMPKVQRVEELPNTSIQIKTFLQHRYNTIAPSVRVKTPLQLSSVQMPTLYKFLDHFAASTCSVNWEPVSEVDLSSVLRRVPEETDAPGPDSQVVVTILTGVPGSYVENLCDALSGLSKEQNRYLVVKPPIDSATPFNAVDIHTTLRAALHADRRRRELVMANRSTRVIYVPPAFADIVEVVQAVVCHPDQDVRDHCKIGAVSVCIDPLNAILEHKYTYPVLLNLCAQGWVNQIIITSSTTGPSSELDDLQHMLRSVNSDVSFLLAEQGQVTRSMDIDAILSDSSFNEPEKVRARYLLTPTWCTGTYKASPSQMSSLLLKFSLPLDKTKLLTRLRGLKKTLQSYPFADNIYCVRGRIRVTGESTDPVEFQYVTLSGSLSMSAVHTDSGKERDSRNFVVFTGCQLEQSKLKDWLRSCAPQKPEKKARVTRKDITRDEIKKIHAEHHLEPLPAGWFYNGTQFVSFDGIKQDLHPELEGFISVYIDKKNQVIDGYNLKVEEMLNDFKDLFT